MLRICTIVFTLMGALFASAQIDEKFSDGNFTSSPVWEGDDSLFQVNGLFQLQSKGTAGTSKDISLATASATTADCEWSVWVRFGLSPSASNFCRYYLMSDVMNLKGPLNGYYVQFGGVTGTTDSITLYKQSGTTRIRIIGGRPSTVSKNNNLVRIKVLRDHSGNWTLYSDTLGGTNFVLEGTGTDNEFNTSWYSGFFVRFTSSNINAYYLDDVYAGPPVVDHASPTIDSVQVINTNTIRVVFNEAVEATSATDEKNYLVSGEPENPVSAVFESGKKHVVLLQFFSAFTNKTSYTLTVSGVLDLNGNIQNSQTVHFSVFNAVLNDVLISELMPDPTPAVSLPEQEFIEIYNNTNVPINMQGWSLSDGGTPAVLPSVTLFPDSFMLVCSATQSAQFAGFGPVVGVSNFSSLNNAGDRIFLKDKNGTTIHEIAYDLTWYHDTDKDDGGWTIELINPLDLCKGKKNYKASVDAMGGTPGKRNSSWVRSADITAPALSYVKVVNASRIQFVFDEKMDSAVLANAPVVFSSGIVASSRNIKGPDYDTLEILLSAPLQSGVSYSYTISSVKDCNQNTASLLAGNVSFLLPEEALVYDVLIHEIMADPDPVVGLPNAEYIELYNRSRKNISLKGWILDDGTAKCILPDVIIQADSFVVFTGTTNKTALKVFGTTYGVTFFPSLSNDGKRITLRNHQGQLIHSVNYSSSWYGDNLKKNGGWSLEMVDVKNPCGQGANWKASTNNNGGTPGKRNSVKGVSRDHDPPKLIRAYPESPNILTLYFNEELDSSSLVSAGQYVVNNNIGPPEAALPKAFEYSSITLFFANQFQKNEIYRVIVDSVRDCAGNAIDVYDYADFGIADSIDSADIVINEILFNPRTGGYDYVEVYNRSNKILDLKRIMIGNTDDQNAIKDFYPVAPSGFVMLPSQHIVLTTNAASLGRYYYVQNPNNVLPCGMPSFPDDKGSCVILDGLGRRYDQLNYDHKMHFALLDNKDGVSLERIDYNRLSADRTNWTSASASSGLRNTNL